MPTMRFKCSLCGKSFAPSSFESHTIVCQLRNTSYADPPTAFERCPSCDQERPPYDGTAYAIAYLAFMLYGFLIGFALGWFL